MHSITRIFFSMFVCYYISRYNSIIIIKQHDFQANFKFKFELWAMIGVILPTISHHIVNNNMAKSVLVDN